MTLQQENNTLKGIGVSVPLIDQKPLSSFSSPNEIVNDLVDQLSIKSPSSKLRQWIQFMAHENLMKKYPTSEDISKYFKCSKSHVKHRIVELKTWGILEEIAEKKGRHDQLILSNILIEDTDNGRSTSLVSEEQLSLQLRTLKSFLDRENYSLHNIHIIASLNDKSDYNLINWPINSKKNGGKVAKFPISRLKGRYVTITAYPRGSVDISLSCSKNPFDFTTIEGPANFHAACGQIYNIIQAATSNSDALKDEPYDWWMTECDLSSDIKVPNLEHAINGSTKPGTDKIHWNFGGSIQVKHLSILYQFYDRNTINGKVHRMEERIHFSPSKRIKLRDLEKKFLDKQITDLLDTIEIRDLKDPE